jgi:hypothetical protein
MIEINKPTERTHWTAHSPDGTIHSGVTETNQVTTTGQQNMEYNSDPELYAGQLEAAGLASELPPLPAEGEECTKDAIYNWDGKAVICYQTHSRMLFDPSETPALFGLAKVVGAPWVQPQGAHDAYELGAIVTHNGQTWQSLVDANVWEPGAVGAESLWAAQ